MADPKPRKVPIQPELRNARSVITNLNAISRALDVTRIAATKTFQIDRQIQNVAIQIGNTSSETRKMTDTVLGLSNATGLSTDRTTQLVTALAAAGQSVGDVDSSLRGSADAFDTLTNNAARNIEVMAELTGRHGISAAAVVQTNASLLNMGESLTSLTDDVTQWQKAYRIPGLIGQIPEAVGFAEKSITRFGKLVVGDGRAIVDATLKLGATYSKVYGVDITRAIQMAQQHQQHFMQELATASDVYLGLADDFGPLSKALFESGMQMNQIQDLMQKGQDDPAAFAESILQMEEQMKQTYGENSIYVKRFHQNVLRNSSEQVRVLLEEEHALHRLQKAREDAAKRTEAMGSSAKAFDDMTASLKSVGATAITTFKNLLDLGRTIIGLTIADTVTETFKGLEQTMQDFNQRVNDQIKRVRAWIDQNPKLVAGIQKVAKVAIILGGAAGSLAGALSSVYFPLISIRAVLTRLPGVGAPIAGIFSRIGSAATFLGKKILWPLSIVTAIGKALNDFGKQLSDPTLSGSEKFVRLIRSIATAAVDTIDDLLLGIPSKIARFFFPNLRGSLSDGLKRMFNRLLISMRQDGTRTISQLFESIGSWVSTKLDQLWGWMRERIGGWKEGARELGTNIGRALAELAHWAWEGIKKLPGLIERGFKMMVAWMNGEGGPKFNSTLSNIFFGALDVIGEFTGAMVDEVLMSFGYSLAELRADAMDIIDWFKGAWDAWTYIISDPVKAGLLLTYAQFKMQMANIKYLVGSVWEDLRDTVAKAVGQIIQVSVEPLIKGYAEVVWQYHRVRYAVEGDSYLPQLMKAQEEYNQAIGTASNIAGEMAKTTQDAIAQSSVDYMKAMQEAGQAQADYETFNRERLAREGTNRAEYERRAKEREEARRTRREEAKRVGAEGRASREAERLKRIADAAAAEQARAPIVNQIQSILEVAQRYQQQAQQAGNIGAARNIGMRISRIEEAMEYAQLTSKSSALQQYLDYVKKLVGEQVVKEAASATAQPGEGTQGAYAPTTPQGSSGYANAPDRVGAGSVLAPSTTDVSVAVGGQVRNRVDIGFRGRYGEIFDIFGNPDETINIVGAGGAMT